jgi:hypothetical protein
VKNLIVLPGHISISSREIFYFAFHLGVINRCMGKQKCAIVINQKLAS